MVPSEKKFHFSGAYFICITRKTSSLVGRYKKEFKTFLQASFIRVETTQNVNIDKH
jgi:hypothetical protein